MNSLFQITSSAPRKQCDFFANGSLHPERNKIPSFCEVTEVISNIETKECSGFCGLTFPKDWPFVKASQIGDEEMCIRCYGKKYVAGRKNYYEAIRAELLLELNHSK